MADINSNHKTVLDNLLLSHPLVRAGKMFGFPAYYVDRKLCICLYEEGVGVKLPAPSVVWLLASDPNAIPFAFYLPYVPFEAVIGLWLIIKGLPNNYIFLLGDLNESNRSKCLWLTGCAAAQRGCPSDNQG
jgi:hypothetical protein